MPGDGSRPGVGREDSDRHARPDWQEGCGAESPERRHDVFSRRRSLPSDTLGYSLPQSHGVACSFTRSGGRLSKLVQALDTPRIGGQRAKANRKKVEIGENPLVTDHSNPYRRLDDATCSDTSDDRHASGTSVIPAPSRLTSRRHSIAVVPSVTLGMMSPVTSSSPRGIIGNDHHRKSAANYRTTASQYFTEAAQMTSNRSTSSPHKPDTAKTEIKPLFPILKNRRSQLTTAATYTLPSTHFRSPGYKVSFREEIEEINNSTLLMRLQQRRGSLPEEPTRRETEDKIVKFSEVNTNFKLKQKAPEGNNQALLPSRQKTHARTMPGSRARRRYSIADIPQHSTSDLTPRATEISCTAPTDQTQELWLNNTEQANRRSSLDTETECEDGNSLLSSSGSSGAEEEEEDSDNVYGEPVPGSAWEADGEVQDDGPVLMKNYSDSAPVTREDGVVVYVCHAHVPLAKMT